MELDQSEFQKRFKNSPVLRTKRRGLLRNVAIALGNWGNPQAIPALELVLLEQEPLIRSHSAWGLGQVATKKAYDILENALTSEEDPQVIKEIREALSACKEKKVPNLKRNFSDSTAAKG